MKKGKSELNDWGRAGYKRSDFGEIVRGKYAKRISESTNVVVIEPQIAKAFPNDRAVNAALRKLMTNSSYKTKARTKRKNKPAEKRRAA